MFESIKNKEIKQRRYFKLILGLFISVYYLQNLVNNEKLTQDLMIKDFQYIYLLLKIIKYVNQHIAKKIKIMQIMLSNVYHNFKFYSLSTTPLY